MATTPETRRHELASGLTLVADHWGEPAEDAVLFLHGGGQTRHSWGGTARAMAAAGRYAITLDMRGHGESDWTDEGAYQLSTFADDAKELIDQLGVRPSLVGASLGGMTGVLLEGDRHPGTLSALVLVDIIPKMNPAGADRVKEFMLANAKTGFATLEEVADAVSAYNPHRPRPSDLEGLKKNLRHRDGRWYWHWDPRFIELGMSELRAEGAAGSHELGDGRGLGACVARARPDERPGDRAGSRRVPGGVPRRSVRRRQRCRPHGGGRQERRLYRRRRRLPGRRGQSSSKLKGGRL